MSWSRGGDRVGGQGKKATNLQPLPQGNVPLQPWGVLPQWPIEGMSETCKGQRKGSVQLSLSPLSREGLQWPYISRTKSHLTCHVSSHVRCQVSYRCTQRLHPSPRGYYGTMLLHLPSAATTSQFGCHGKSNSICLCRKWPPESELSSFKLGSTSSLLFIRGQKNPQSEGSY